MYNHNKAQQSKNRVHISWDILYVQAPNGTLASTGIMLVGIASGWSLMTVSSNRWVNAKRRNSSALAMELCLLHQPIEIVLTHWTLWDSKTLTISFSNAICVANVINDSFSVKLHCNACLRSEVNIGSGNGLVPSGTKPLPETMLTHIYSAK